MNEPKECWLAKFGHVVHLDKEGVPRLPLQTPGVSDEEHISANTSKELELRGGYGGERMYRFWVNMHLPAVTPRGCNAVNKDVTHM